MQVDANLVGSQSLHQLTGAIGLYKMSLVKSLHMYSKLKPEHVCKDQESIIVSPYQTGRLSIENLDPTQAYVLWGYSLLWG